MYLIIFFSCLNNIISRFRCADAARKAEMVNNERIQKLTDALSKKPKKKPVSRKAVKNILKIQRRNK